MLAHRALSVRLALLTGAGLWLLVVVGCVAREGGIAPPVQASPSEQELLTMANDNAFAAVPLNTREQHAASPSAPEPGWRGIVIRAPKRVVFGPNQPESPDGAFARVPICGLYVMDATTAPSSGSLMLVARDLITGKVYRGVVGEYDASPDEPPPVVEPVDPELLEGLTVEGYFNPNLAHYVDLPRDPTTYEVHAQWGSARSNAVRIELVNASSSGGT